MTDARPRQSGMTTTEVLIMASIMSVLMIMITESMTTLSSVRHEQQTRFKVADVADRVARQIDKDLQFASRIFCNNVEDNQFLNRLDLATPLKAPNHRLPTLTDRGYFEPDSTTIETGNVLFLARRGPKLLVDLQEEGSFLFDSLQFIVYAPVEDGGSLELIRWASDLMLNYWDIAEIDDLAVRSDVLMQLEESGVMYAWDPLAPASGALWDLVGGILAPLDANDMVLGAEDPMNSRPFGERSMQIAENDWSNVIKVPAFTTANGAFPGGFELRADGSTAGKLILLRLVARSTKANVGDVGCEIRRFFYANG